MSFPSSVVAQKVEVETPKEMTPPTREPKFPEVGNLHDVEVAFPRNQPILKDRKIVPESAVVPSDQNYQAACQDGDVQRCSGVDLTTFESTIRVPKSERMLSRLNKPLMVNIKLLAEADERRPSSKKRHHKRR